MKKQVTATDLSRNFSDYINRVELNGEEFTVMRNDRQVATLTPTALGRTARDVFDALFGVLPEAAARTWLADAKAPRRRKSELRDPWAS